MNISTIATTVANAVNPKTLDYFSNLEKDGGPLSTLTNILAEAFKLLQTYVYLPVGFALLLIVICLIGGKQGREYAKNKFLWTVIFVLAAFSVVGIVGLIVSAFGGNASSLENAYNSLS